MGSPTTSERVRLTAYKRRKKPNKPQKMDERRYDRSYYKENKKDILKGQKKYRRKHKRFLKKTRQRREKEKRAVMQKGVVVRELVRIAKLISASRARVAWQLNAASISLEQARQYAEEQFAAAGQELDKVLPDFDANFKLLKSKLGSAKNVPRIQMPVIEPSDMTMFNKRLNQGAIDIFKPYARGKLHLPKSMSKKEGEEWVTLGFADGKPNDDSIKARMGSTAAKSLLPTQSQIWFDKLIQNIIKYGPAASGSPILKQTIIVSKEGYILDGHHRFGQAILSDPSLALRSLSIPLGIDVLLKIGKTYGEAIGNRPKASVRYRRGSLK